MADICMCANSDKCPHKDTCYRALAKADEYMQSFANFYQDWVECNYYWECTSEEQLKCLNDINN